MSAKSDADTRVVHTITNISAHHADFLTSCKEDSVLDRIVFCLFTEIVLSVKGSLCGDAVSRAHLHNDR